MNLTPWTLLDLDPGCTEQALKRRYAERIKAHRPEIDPQGFARVRAAYELILAHLRLMQEGQHQAPPHAGLHEHAAAPGQASPDRPLGGWGHSHPPPTPHPQPAASPDSAGLDWRRPAFAPLADAVDPDALLLRQALAELETWFLAGQDRPWWQDRPASLGHVHLLADKLDRHGHATFVRESLRLYLAHGTRAPWRARQWGALISGPGSAAHALWQQHAAFHARVGDLVHWIEMWRDTTLHQALWPWMGADQRDWQRPWFCAEDDLAWPPAALALAEQRLRLQGVNQLPPTPRWLEAMRQGPRILHSEWTGALVAAMTCLPQWWLALTRGSHLRDPEAVAAAAPWDVVLLKVLLLTLLMTGFLSGCREWRRRVRLRTESGPWGSALTWLSRLTTPEIRRWDALRWLLCATLVGSMLTSALVLAGLQSWSDLPLWIARFAMAGWVQTLLHLGLSVAEVRPQLDALSGRLARLEPRPLA